MTTQANKDKSASDIAIIGMGCLFPKSPDLKAYWRLLYHRVDGITDIPSSHWQPQDYFDPDPRKPDHVYCKRGGFLSPIDFDPTEFGIPPASLDATDTSQLLALVVAKMALEDAGYWNERNFNRDRTSVILGVTGTQELVIPLGARLGHPRWREALRQAGVSETQTESVMKHIADSYVPWQQNSFPGLLGNVVAGRISNRLDLGGTNCVVDAACASSLSAIHLAVMELTTGRSDMVISGGVDTLNDIFMHMCFSKTQTLSPTGDARPFSKNADGTVLGEGVGMLVLKRLADAEQDNDRIYAVIKGIGTASDGRSNSIYAPRAEGQAHALNQAYASANIDPKTIELLEAHGTGTRVGDAVEFKSLTQVFGNQSKNGHRCAVGSVKSNIGHTKAAAGSAGLIKAALALHTKILPPTLKAEEADPHLDIENSPFYLNQQAQPWFTVENHPRRSGISAFGFGGSNFHVVLEEYRSQKKNASWDGSVDIIAFSGPSRHELEKSIHRFQKIAGSNASEKEIAAKAAESRRQFKSGDSHRLLCLLDRTANSEINVPAQLNEALHVIQSPDASANMLSNNIFEGHSDGGKLAFVFPGQGSQYVNMGRDLTCFFPEALAAIQAADQCLHWKKPLSQYIYPPTDGAPGAHPDQKHQLMQTQIAQPALGAVSLAMLKILERFDIKPDATAGHSYGELLALYAAGWIGAQTLLNLSEARGKAMADAAGLRPGTMTAVQASFQTFKGIVDAIPNLDIANKNSPHQAVISGTLQAVAKAENQFRQNGINFIRLPVSAAFHSPLMESALKPFQKILQQTDFYPTSVPVYANTTANPYPQKTEDIQRLLGQQISNPVEFASEIKNLYESGVRTFLEIGPKSVLTGLIESICPEKDVTALALDASGGRRFGMVDLARTICLLASQGFPLKLECWEDTVSNIRKPRMSVSLSGANYRGSKPSPHESSGQQQKSMSVTTPKSNTERKTDSRSNPWPPVKNDIKPTTIEPKPMKKHPMNQSQQLKESLQIVQEGLKSMQRLQQQTADAHKKFLETQTQAGQTLQQMMARTQRLAEIALGIKPEASIDDTGHLNGIAGQNQIKSSLNESIPPAQETAATQPAISGTGDIDPLPESPVDTNAQAIANSAPDSETDALPSQEVNTSPNSQQQLLTNTLMEVVSQLTGYPVETIDMDMDIEADLGIDSIKRVEILSTLEETMPGLPSVSPEMMGSLKTLAQIVDFLASQSNPATETSANSIPDTATSQSIETANHETAQKLSRKRVLVVPKPWSDKKPATIARDCKIYISDGAPALADALQQALCDAGWQAEVISLTALIEGKTQDPSAGLIILAPPPVSGTPISADDSDEFATQAFLAARTLAPQILSSAQSSGAFFATVAHMDGAFGFNGAPQYNPVQGALAGLAKTASIEWDGVLCRAFDVDPAWQDHAAIASQLVSELTAPDLSEPTEICLGPKKRSVLELQETPHTSSSIENLNIASGDVLIVSGGARGITAHTARMLAHYTQPTLILLGRSPKPSPEPTWLSDLKDEAQIKRAIVANQFGKEKPTPAAIESAFKDFMAAREIQSTLSEIQLEGAKVAYCQADIRQADQVQALVDDIRSRYGPIRGIIHAAGVLADRFIVDKSESQFQTVYQTKVHGIRNLLHATADDPLKHIILFSSVSARMGNRGQVDYAMANEVLNKMANIEQFKRPDCKIVAINWGPWDGGMVSPSLKKEFERNGIGLIPPAKGAYAMLQEMSANHNSPHEIVLGADGWSAASAVDRYRDSKAHAPPPPSIESEELFLTLKSEIDTDQFPILNSHVLDGKPVVPFALMTEWLGHGALHGNPGLYLCGIDDMRVFNGIKLDQEKKIIRLLAGKVRKNGKLFEVDVAIRNGIKDGQPVIHSQAKAILADKMPEPPSFDLSAFRTEKPYDRTISEVYDQILFHGLDLHGIKNIECCTPRVMLAQIESAPPPHKWIVAPMRSKWVADPLVLDSAFQMATVWCFENKGMVSLPSYSASYRQFCREFPQGSVTAVLEIKDVSSHKMRGDFTFIDADENVIAQLTGYEAVMDAGLYKAFKPERAVAA